MTRALGRRLVAEMLGTARLLMAVVESGITVGGSPSGLFAHAAVVGVSVRPSPPEDWCC